jgi:mono/diheme cytochrome c family protein
MSKPSISALVAASVVFSTTLLVVAQQSATVNPLAGNPAAIQAGGKLFDRKCAKCHGPEGQGDPNDAPPLNTMSFIHGREDAEVFHTNPVWRGQHGHGGPSYVHG